MSAPPHGQQPRHPQPPSHGPAAGYGTNYPAPPQQQSAAYGIYPQAAPAMTMMPAAVQTGAAQPPPLQLYKKPFVGGMLEKLLRTFRPDVKITAEMKAESMERYAYDTWQMYRRRVGIPLEIPSWTPAQGPAVLMTCQENHQKIFKSTSAPDPFQYSEGLRMQAYKMPPGIFGPLPPVPNTGSLPQFYARPDRSTVQNELRSILHGPPPQFGPHPFPGPMPVVPYGFNQRQTSPLFKSSANLQNHAAQVFAQLKAELGDRTDNSGLHVRLVGYRLEWTTLVKSNGSQSASEWYICHAVLAPGTDYPRGYVLFGHWLDYKAKGKEDRNGRIVDFLIDADKWVFAPAVRKGKYHEDRPGYVKEKPVFKCLMGKAGLHTSEDPREHWDLIFYGPQSTFITIHHSEHRKTPQGQGQPAMPVASSSSRAGSSRRA